MSVYTFADSFTQHGHICLLYSVRGAGRYHTEQIREANLLYHILKHLHIMLGDSTQCLKKGVNMLQTYPNSLSPQSLEFQPIWLPLSLNAQATMTQRPFHFVQCNYTTNCAS